MAITQGQSWGKRYSVWGHYDQFWRGRSPLPENMYHVDCMEHGIVNEQNNYGDHAAALHDHLHEHDADGFYDRPSGCDRWKYKRGVPAF